MGVGGRAGGRHGNTEGSPPPCAPGHRGLAAVRLPPYVAASDLGGVPLRLIFQRAARLWGAPGDGTPVSPPWPLWKGACGAPASLEGGAGRGRAWAGDRRALGGGPPGRGASGLPLPRCRCSWCLGLPPAASDASLGRLLVPPPGCADSWDATSLRSWNSELIPLGLDRRRQALVVGGRPQRPAGSGWGARGERFPIPGRLQEKARGREGVRRAGGRDTQYL